METTREGGSLTLTSAVDRNLFVSAGTDGLAHLGSLQHSEPLLSLKVSDSYVFQVQWSPSRPLVLAAATAQGGAAGTFSAPPGPDPVRPRPSWAEKVAAGERCDVGPP